MQTYNHLFLKFEWCNHSHWILSNSICQRSNNSIDRLVVHLSQETRQFCVDYRYCCLKSLFTWDQVEKLLCEMKLNTKYFLNNVYCSLDFSKYVKMISATRPHVNEFQRLCNVAWQYCSKSPHWLLQPYFGLLQWIWLHDVNFNLSLLLMF